MLFRNLRRRIGTTRSRVAIYLVAGLLCTFMIADGFISAAVDSTHPRPDTELLELREAAQQNETTPEPTKYVPPAKIELPLY